MQLLLSRVSMDLLNTFLRHAAKFTSKVILHVNVIDFEQSHGRESLKLSKCREWYCVSIMDFRQQSVFTCTSRKETHQNHL